MSAPADAMKARFIAVAGHDLRQPLQTLGILTELLRRRVADPEAGALVERQESALWSLREALESFLDPIRADCGAIVPEQRVFPLREVMDGVQEALGERMRQRGVRFDVVVSSASVRSDPALLQRIAEILVGTAMQYAGARRIVLGARRRAGRPWLEMRYAGEAGDHGRIVALLRDPQPDSGVPGFGLGLSAARRYAELLGLGFAAWNTAGGITTVDLSLPAA
jgi:two-component system CheB/CheR fusion protein